MTQISGPEDEEIHVIRRAVERESGSADSIIFVVVPWEKNGPISQMIKQMKKAKRKTHAKVVVTTPESLQDSIKSNLTRSYNKLFLLATPDIKTITYNISNMVESVHVAPCKPTTRQGVLRIGSRSTYCGLRAYAWALRDEKLSSYKLEHAEGCFFDLSDDLDEAKRLLGATGSAPDMTDAEMEAIKNKIMELQDDDDTGSPTNTATAEGPASTPSSSVPSPGRSSFWRWWDKWKFVVAACVGGATVFMGANAGGIFLAGAAGLAVAVRAFSMGAGGGAIAAEVGINLVASAMVYFIPWEKVIPVLQQTLRRVWETIKGAISWVWEKIKEMVSAVRSAAQGVFPSPRVRRVKIQ